MLCSLLERLDDEVPLAALLLLLAGAFATDLEDLLRDAVLLLFEVAFATDLCVLLACGFLYCVLLLVAVLLLGVCVTVLLETDFR